MATLQELKGLMKDSDLQDKIQVSLIIGVQAILDGTPSTDDKKYAAHVFSNTVGEGQKALMSVLAQNEGMTVSQIQGASESAIKTQVAGVIDTLSSAYNAGV